MKFADKMITRTIITLEVSVIGINANGNVETLTLTAPAMDEKKLAKYIPAVCPDGFSPARILKVSTVEQLYGMRESVFLAHAEKLPPRTNSNKDEG